MPPDEPRSIPIVPVEATDEGPPKTAGTEASQTESGGRGVVVLLSVAAMLAAIIATRASILSSEASDHWQKSVGEEQKRGAYLMEGVRFTYGDEGDMAFMIASEQLRAEELKAASAAAAPDVASRLETEARVHEQVVLAMRSSSQIATDPQYLLPSGGYDLQSRLADERQELGDDLRIDPSASVAAGDRASGHSLRLLATMLVVGFAFLFGSLGQTIASRRRLLLGLGWMALLVTAALALALEVA